MIHSTLARLVSDKLITRDFTVLWHAGEPLVMPIAFYEKSFALIRQIVPAHIKVTHSFQTNGLLLTRDWCGFFKRNKVELGISLDGPGFIHDRHRRTRSGKGTFLKVLEAVELAQQYEIDFTILSVVTAFSCRHPAQIYEFFRELKVRNLSFNVEEVEGVNNASSFSNLTDAKKMVGDFLATIYRLNVSHSEPIRIREIDWAKSRLLYSNLHPDGVLFTQLTGAFRTVTVDYQGNFSTFSPELIAQKNTIYGDFILGNVMTDSFIQAASSSKFQHMWEDLVKGLNRCKSNCDYYGACSGGTPSNKLSQHQTLDAGETLHCQLVFQTPLDTILLMNEEEQKCVNTIST